MVCALIGGSSQTFADTASVGEKKPAFKPRPLADILEGKLVRLNGNAVEPGEFNDRLDYVVLYFSAHWCPTCRKVTPRLVEFYSEQRKEHKNFEVVFISSDRNEKEMLQYMRGYEMPWLALKFAEKAKTPEIKRCAGRGVPCVVVLDSNGREIAHSFEGGKYQGPMKPLQKLAKILDGKGPLVGMTN